MSRRFPGKTKRQGAQLILSTVLGVLAASHCVAQGGLAHARQMLQRFDEERQRAAGTSASSRFTLEYVDGRLKDVGAAVNTGLISMLNGAAPPSCAALQVDLRRALGYRGQGDSNVASVACVRWRGRIYYVVGYALARELTYSRSWIGVFGPPAQGRRYQILAAADNTLPSKTVAVKPIWAPVGGNLRFLAYGINWGDAHNRLTVIAYSLEGRELKPIWSRSDLPEGQVEMADGKLRLKFLSSLLGPGYKSVHEVLETYRVTPFGIKLESRSEALRE